MQEPCESSFWDVDENLELCERILGRTFSDRQILKQALTHASAASDKLDSNERLEFMGDSVLGMIVCRRLYAEFPESMEGELTEIKSAVVSRDTLSRIGREAGLEKCVLVGKGVADKGHVPDSILGNAFESLTAALYLDGGFEVAQKFVLHYLEDEILSRAPGGDIGNYKSRLQELLQKNSKTVPDYRVTDESGPDHDKRFSVTVFLNDAAYGSGHGTTKKEAEQQAAKYTLLKIEDEDG